MRWILTAVVLATASLTSCQADQSVPKLPTAATLHAATAAEAQDIAVNWHRYCFSRSVYGREHYFNGTEMERLDIAPRRGRYSVSDNVLCTQIGGEPDRCRALFVGPSGPVIYVTDSRDIRGSDRWISCRPYDANAQDERLE